MEKLKKGNLVHCPDFAPVVFNIGVIKRYRKELLKLSTLIVAGVDIRSCEWTAYKFAQNSMQYDFSSSSWSGDYLDPSSFLDL